ncbi:MAG: hypothetical protein A2Y07_01875 [Planctomycetes bacterium GWF2_50_10]|nr:MAG: hypothetical protein A2Y07_01875 [Planctomycetes bacterium GWF2_50_10]
MAIRVKKSGFREKVLAGIKGRASGSSLGFRLMPMIDVLFLLLIFFLLTTKFHAQEAALPFRLPAASGDVMPGKVLPLEINLSQSTGKCVVEIHKDQEDSTAIYLGEEEVEENLALFANEMAGAIKVDGRTAADPVELVCGKEVMWQYVAKVYNVLYGMGISDITFRIVE